MRHELRRGRAQTEGGFEAEWRHRRRRTHTRSYRRRWSTAQEAARQRKATRRLGLKPGYLRLTSPSAPTAWQTASIRRCACVPHALFKSFVYVLTINRLHCRIARARMRTPRTVWASNYTLISVHSSKSMYNDLGRKRSRRRRRSILDVEKGEDKRWDEEHRDRKRGLL